MPPSLYFLYVCIVISIPHVNTASQPYQTSDGGKMENINLTFSKEPFTAIPDLPGWVSNLLAEIFF